MENTFKIIQDRALEFKNQGNEKFKGKDYKQAISFYSKGLQAIDKVPKSEQNEELRQLQFDLLSNRSLSYFYNQTYLIGLEDAEEALKIKPDDDKALYRASINSFGLSEELHVQVSKTKDWDLTQGFYQKLQESCGRTKDYVLKVLKTNPNNQVLK